MNSQCRDTVLVIDDDSDFRELVEAMGGLCSVPVLQAADCHKALTILEREHDRVKMILLDYLMPGMEPRVCTAALIAKAGPSIPIILVTAAADPDARARDLNLSRWLAKPFDASTLMNLLSTG